MINQFKAKVTYGSHCNHIFFTCVQEHCPGETGLPSSGYQATLRNVSSPTYPSVGLSENKQTMQLIISGKVEFNACQVSLMWLNSFLVSL